MFVSLKTLLHTLILPPGSLLLVAIGGAWLLGRHQAGRARRLGVALLALGLGGLWLLSVPAVADLLLRAADRVPALDPAKVADAQAQAIVILAGGSANRAAPEYGNAPSAGDALLERLAYGAYLAHRTGLPVLVSGDFAESDAMRTVLARDFGVTTRWTESRSRDTFQNAAYSAPLLKAAGVSRILLVTSASHAYRAMREFEAAGLSVVPAPVGIWTPQERSVRHFLPSLAGLRDSAEALYELVGDAAQRLFTLTHLRRQGAVNAPS